MLVDLRELQPNPMRDFTVDPMDQDRVEELRKSIEEDGFWGGVCCRQTEDGEIQIAAGHTRVASAILAGHTHADLFVGNGGTATAGNGGTATAGNGGTATAGYRGTIQVSWWDESASRRRIQTGYIGENGLLPNVAYRLVDGQWSAVTEGDS